jgi:hypothetical protein
MSKFHALLPACAASAPGQTSSLTSVPPPSKSLARGDGVEDRPRRIIPDLDVQPGGRVQYDLMGSGGHQILLSNYGKGGLEDIETGRGSAPGGNSLGERSPARFLEDDRDEGGRLD